MAITVSVLNYLFLVFSYSAEVKAHGVKAYRISDAAAK